MLKTQTQLPEESRWRLRRLKRKARLQPPQRPFQSATSLSEASTPLLHFRDLRKAFGGQTVLDGISGEIHER